MKGEGGPVSFRGCEGTHRSLVVSSSVFFFRGDGGQSASCVWLAQRLTRVRKCALSGRDFVRKGFCQEGILSGRNFFRLIRQFQLECDQSFFCAKRGPIKVPSQGG